MAVPLTKGHLSSGIGNDSIQMLFGARCPEVVGSNPTPATKTKLRGAIMLPFFNF